MTEQDPQQHLVAALAGLWRAGCAFVATIQDFEPELILALYHAVQGPLAAARAIWDTQCAGEPFPPVAVTNLGREKTRRFEDVREELGFLYPYIEWMSESWETGHFMAWAAQQETWLVELAAQIQAVWRNAEPPKRVLVLDDFIHEGATWVLVSGLTLHLYPDAEICTVGGNLGGWKHALGEIWLQEQEPETYARMCADRETVAERRAKQSALDMDAEEFSRAFFYHGFSDVAKLVTGTEDVDPDSLVWRPITETSPIVQRLSVYLPAERWLELAPWAFAHIERYVRAQSAEAFAQGVAEVRAERNFRLQRLTPWDLLMREAWLGRSFARRDVMRFDRVGFAEARYLLRRGMQERLLARSGRGGGTRYSIAHNYGILAYGSLLEDPGAELEPVIIARIPVSTPFAVEYARSSRSRAGAPTLVPVAASMGAPVAAQILVLRPDLPEEELRDRLYRREINRVGNCDYTYNNAEQREKKDAVLIETALGLGGVPTVYYTVLKANIQEVLRADLSAEAKVERLAELALGSVTPKTYAEGRDGIQYLADAIAHGIETPLTAAYRAAILRRAGDAPDLETARERALSAATPKS